MELIDNLKSERLEGISVAKLMKRYKLQAQEILKYIRENGFKSNRKKDMIRGDVTEIHELLDKYNKNTYSELVYGYDGSDCIVKLELKNEKNIYYYQFYFSSKVVKYTTLERKDLLELDGDYYIFNTGNGFKFLFLFEDDVTCFKYLPDTHPRTSGEKND